METVEFITPSGHKVYLRPYLTYTDKRELRKIYLNYMSIDAQTKKANTAINGKATLEAQEYALKAMIIRLVDKTGKAFEGPNAYDAIMQWQSEADGDAVMEKVNELTSLSEMSEDDKKK